MDCDSYVRSIISKYALTARTPAATAAAQTVYQIIRVWAHTYLLGVSYSGSSAKGTAISGIADVDLFISLNPQTPGTLAEIYNSLLNYRGLSRLSPRPQNVSIGINYAGLSIDLVPGKKQSGSTTDHSVFKNKTGTWTQTNIYQHINLIHNSQRLDEIRALKIWRALHALDFPSFYLELTVLNALRGKRVGAVADNFVAILDYLRTTFRTALVVDPANSNNRISDDLTPAEKKTISDRGATSLQLNWNQVLW
jgi:hypothetical protein